MAPDRDLYANSIYRAADTVGGLDTLALILNVRLCELTAWTEGRRPPTDIFMKIVAVNERTTSSG